MQKFLFYNKFVICLYMFRTLCVHHQEVKIVLYSISYHPVRPVYGLGEDSQPVPRTATYWCDDTRCCIIQF